MSVSYTALNQGQGGEENSQPSDSHSTPSAPMAKVEADGLDGPHEENHRVAGNHKEAVPHTNPPHIAVSEASNDEKTNRVYPEDHIDEHLGDSLHINDLHYRAGTPQSSARSPHLGVGLHFDTELGSIAGDTLPDINVYQHKKTLAQGMMDLALFSANANQLRYVLDSYQRHPYYWPSFIFIVLSLTLQVAIGIGLTWNALYDVKDEKEICIANKINNFTVIGIFLVVVVNVFISAFGVADPIPQAAVVVTPGT